MVVVYSLNQNMEKKTSILGQAIIILDSMSFITCLYIDSTRLPLARLPLASGGGVRLEPGTHEPGSGVNLIHSSAS